MFFSCVNKQTMDKFLFKSLAEIVLCLWLERSTILVLTLQATQPFKYFWNFKCLLFPVRWNSQKQCWILIFFGNSVSAVVGWMVSGFVRCWAVAGRGIALRCGLPAFETGALQNKNSWQNTSSEAAEETEVPAKSIHSLACPLMFWKGGWWTSGEINLSVVCPNNDQLQLPRRVRGKHIQFVSVLHFHGCEFLWGCLLDTWLSQMLCKSRFCKK